MAAKKKKGKKSPAVKEPVGIRQWLNIPEQIIQLRPRNQRRRGFPVHYLITIGCTRKSWIPATSRCIKSGDRKWPELYRLGDSPDISPASRCCYSFRNASTVYFTDERIWIRYKCTTIDPFDAKRKYIEFTSIFGFQGIFYALSLQGSLAIIEEIDSRLTITRISSKRCVPSVSSRCFKEYVVELDGEILLIFFIHQKSLESVDGIEVFRLCCVELKWIKIEKLQGKTLFLDQRFSWVNSAEIGCKGDCIYFTQGSDNGWWIYDMENCSISPV